MPSIILNLRSNDGVDHLTFLPSEVQQNIISHLLPTHDPDLVPRARRKLKIAADHSLDYLAATCRTLRNEVMMFARLWLIKHRDSLKNPDTQAMTAKPADKKESLERNYLRGPRGLMNYVNKRCVFCGRNTVRSAIVMNGLACCRRCDGTHWPDKITRTNAKEEYDLRDHHLFPHQYAPTGLPRIRYGKYDNTGQVGTIFLRSDVIAQAKRVHGADNLEPHLAKRAARRAERAEKRKEAQYAREQAAKGNAAGTTTVSGAPPALTLVTSFVTNSQNAVILPNITTMFTHNFLNVPQMCSREEYDGWLFTPVREVGKVHTPVSANTLLNYMAGPRTPVF